MVQNLTESLELNEQLKLRAEIVSQQARQSVAVLKAKELEMKIQDLRLEIQLWNRIDSECQFRIEFLNEILRTKCF